MVVSTYYNWWKKNRAMYCRLWKRDGIFLFDNINYKPVNERYLIFSAAIHCGDIREIFNKAGLLSDNTLKYLQLAWFDCSQESVIPNHNSRKTQILNWEV